MFIQGIDPCKTWDFLALRPHSPVPSVLLSSGIPRISRWTRRKKGRRVADHMNVHMGNASQVSVLAFSSHDYRYEVHTLGVCSLSLFYANYLKEDLDSPETGNAEDCSAKSCIMPGSLCEGWLQKQGWCFRWPFSLELLRSMFSSHLMVLPLLINKQAWHNLLPAAII